MYEKIIVGFDGSESARDAMALAVGLARISHAHILVANVFPYEPLASSVPPGELEDRLRHDAGVALASARAMAPGGVEVEFRALPGSPAWALHELAEQESADLVVLGSCHRGRLGRAVIGSTAEKLLHGSPCAIAVAPRGYRHRPDAAAQRIGVAFDGTPQGDVAFGAARALAQATGATLRLITVVDLAGPAYGFGFGYGYGEYLDALREEARASLAAIVRDHSEIEIETATPEGTAAVELVSASESLDLLFVGSRGYGPARRVLLGSVSVHVLRGAGCPVVVVPRAENEPPLEPSRSRDEVLVGSRNGEER